MEQIRYSIMDPAGNITALVECPASGPAGYAADSDALAVCQEPAAVAARIMRRHPEVEQVGFVRFSENGSSEDQDPVHASLRMAGGEFCGNASMCAAALYVLRKTGRNRSIRPDLLSEQTVCLSVSGASKPVEIRVKTKEEDCFLASLLMPPAEGISVERFAFDDLEGTLPVVWMEGIFHIIIEPGSVFWRLLKDRNAAERAAGIWCDSLSADGLGLMFLDSGTRTCSLIPLVYVPGSGTIFWEHSCASGSAAAGMYVADKKKRDVRLSLSEPGGVLRVECTGNTTRLFNRVSMRGSYLLDV